jgi:hypothetical protein
MNVFVLHEDVEQSVNAYVDKHVHKMVLEAVQICNTGLHNAGHSELAFYGEGYTNHPWCQYTAEKYKNWRFVADYADVIGYEYIKRYGKPHASHENMTEWDISAIKDALPAGERDEIPQTMLDEYKQSDPIAAYRDYYRNEKLPQEWASYDRGGSPAIL